MFAWMVEKKPELANRAPPGAGAVPWMVANALSSLEGDFHRPHPGVEQSHWRGPEAEARCAAFAPYWNATWWGDCRETCR